MKNFLLFIIIFSFSYIYLSCRDNPTSSDNSDIPNDPTENVPAITNFNLVPSGNFLTIFGERRRFHILNVAPSGSAVELKGTNETNQNVWLTVDGKNKGIVVKKVNPINSIPADIVFCVDVSESMPRAVIDSISAQIVGLDNYLYSFGIDARYAGIGYYGDIRGVKNFTNDVINFRSWIRSTLFQDTLTQVLYPNFGSSSRNENAISAIKFADSTFFFRTGALRIFLVFTDCPIKPSSQPQYSLQWAIPTLRGKASVHTIFIGDTTAFTNLWYPNNLSNQNPKDLSISTGGTYTLLPSSGVGLLLKELTLTEILVNSYTIDFLTNSGKKNVKVIFKLNPSLDGESNYQVDFP